MDLHGKKDHKHDEDVLVTSIWGKEIKFSATDLNTLFGFSSVPEDPPNFSDSKSIKILFSNATFDGNIFKYSPGQMSETNRVIWYLYSRSMVNKGQSYTHFVLKDFQLFASLIAKKPRNLGRWIISKMQLFLSSSRKSTIPFPNLVSQIIALTISARIDHKILLMWENKSSSFMTYCGGFGNLHHTTKSNHTNSCLKYKGNLTISNKN